MTLMEKGFCLCIQRVYDLAETRSHTELQKKIFCNGKQEGYVKQSLH